MENPWSLMENPRKSLVYNGKCHLEVDDLENETTICERDHVA